MAEPTRQPTWTCRRRRTTTTTSSATSKGLLLLAALLAARPVSANRGSPLLQYAKVQTKLVCKYTHLALCPEEATAALRNLTSSLNTDEDGHQTVNVDVVSVRSCTEWSNLKIIIHRCRLPSTAAACEDHFQTWEWPHSICTLVSMKSVVWTPFIEAWSPRIHCPNNAGTYKGRNLTLDYESVLKTLPPFRIEGYLWKIQTLLYDQERKVHVCFTFAGEGKRIKKQLT